MADAYIDVFETIIYGKLAREEMVRLVMPLGEQWVPAIRWAVAAQEKVDARMRAVIARMGGEKIDENEIRQVTDTLVRFGAWMSSLKGRPIDPFHFFAGAAPSDVARARLPKLVGHLERMIERLEPYAAVEESARIEGVVSRLAELREAHAIALRNRDKQRASQQNRRELTPEVEAARQEWLATYVANKYLVEGILRHHDALALKPLIFDDLAERPRTKGASESDAGPGEFEDLVTGTSPPSGPESGGDGGAPGSGG